MVALYSRVIVSSRFSTARATIIHAAKRSGSTSLGHLPPATDFAVARRP